MSLWIFVQVRVIVDAYKLAENERLVLDESHAGLHRMLSRRFHIFAGTRRIIVNVYPRLQRSGGAELLIYNVSN